MSIEFDKIEFEEGEEGQAAAEALKLLRGTEVFTNYVSTAVKAKEEAVRSSAVEEIAPLKEKIDEFRQTNITLKEELEKYDGFDADEYKRLKSLGSDAQAANEQLKRQELEHKGLLDGRDAKITALNTELDELKKGRQEDAFRFEAQAAIHRHNKNFEALAVEPGADAMLIKEMMESHKVVDGKVVMLADGKDFTTDEGIGTIDDWINTYARKQYHFMFAKPTGGGAAGSNSGGAGNKKYADMSEAERVALYKSDPVEFTKLRNADNGNNTIS